MPLFDRLSVKKKQRSRQAIGINFVPIQFESSVVTRTRSTESEIPPESRQIIKKISDKMI